MVKLVAQPMNAIETRQQEKQWNSVELQGIRFGVHRQRSKFPESF
jgi:hypothetical protein